MRALVQRVVRASVTSRPSPDADRVPVGAIDHGLCVLVGATHTDDATIADRMADKIAGLRIFDDDEGVMNRSVIDVGGAVLVVSQFTLYGDCQKGRRPGFTGAAQPAVAEPLYEQFVTALKMLGVPVATGRFGADMQVELVNDGPVTFVIDAG